MYHPRPEGLYIPEVQRKSIWIAREHPDPFAVLHKEQRFMSGWLRRRFQVFDERFTLDGLDVRMSKVRNEVGVAYGAIKHALGRDLPIVEQNTILSYFEDPLSGRPTRSLNRDERREIIEDFSIRQTYLTDRLENRFSGDSSDEAYLGSALICLAMAYDMMESQLTLQSNSQGSV
jgi:hypothetical protein